MFRLVYTLLCSLLIYPLSATHAKKEIIWPLFPTDTLTTGSVSFRSVTVIDQREDKSRFGTAAGGFSRKDIVTADSLPLALANMIQTMTTAVPERAALELLAVVKGIELKESVKDAPMIGSVYLRIDWYLGQQDRYSLVKQTDSLYEFPAPAPIYILANYLLTEAVKEVAAAALPASFPQTLQELLTEAEQARARVAIYNVTPAKGIYYTAEQFRSNTPVAAAYIHKHYGPDLYLDEFYEKDERGKKGKNLADTLCYAIYTGEKWYRPYTQTDFKEMKRTGPDFYYLAIQKGISLENYAALAGVGAPYGIVGALATTAISKALQDKQRRKPIPMADALYRMRVDPVTGDGKRIERLR